jgi:hypothetical protein
MSKLYVHVVFLYSGLYRWTSLSNVYLTTHAGYAVNPQSPQSKVILHRVKETGDLPRQQSNAFDVVFGLRSAEPDVWHLEMWKKSDQVGLLFLLGGSNCWVEDFSCLTLSAAPPHPLPPNNLHQPYWLTPHYTLLTLFTSHALPYIKSVLERKALFLSLEPWRRDQLVVLNYG